MKEPPMLVVKKDVLYCDNIANDEEPINCFIGADEIARPNSDRYVQECPNDFPELCDFINESSFDMIVTDNIEFPGSEKGKKITFNGERSTVSEEFNLRIIQENESVDLRCQESGFDCGFTFDGALICTLSEGEYSGIIKDGELKECTIKKISCRSSII